MRRLVTPPMLGRHALAVGLIGGFLALGWWQVSRASAGNALSWGYAIEWPVFAGFVGFLWYREIRLALRTEPPATPVEGGPAEAALRPPVLGARAPKAGSGFRRPVLVQRKPAAPVPATTAAAADPELDEYNDYLAWLNANPDARASAYPGRRRGPG